MKIRTDFVTNSSSSSFVIAYKEIPETAYQRIIEGIVSCENYDDTGRGEVFRTKEEYEEWFISYYGWNEYKTIESMIENDPGAKKYYDRAIKYLEMGYAILKKNIDHNDDGLIDLIHKISKGNKDFVIIEQDG